MKAKYLDIHNCHTLLPNTFGLSLFARLDECLDWINRRSNRCQGIIDTLIERNERTIKNIIGAKRLCDSPIEIMQNVILEKSIVNTQALERRMPGPALFHIALKHDIGMDQKATIPLQFLLKGWGDASQGHQCYVHTISHNVKQISSFEQLQEKNLSDVDTFYYVGITGRNWMVRLDEHIREMRQGNRRTFYVAWRERYGSDDVLFSSFLKDINQSYVDAMNWEEKTVDRVSYDEYGLNMIAGGFKGLRELYKHRIIDKLEISLEEREKAIVEYYKANSRKGLPNPFIAELWKDDAFYLRVMEAKEKTLSEHQVREIRRLNKEGMLPDRIRIEVSALNETQVKNVIRGRTYKRIK